MNFTIHLNSLCDMIAMLGGKSAGQKRADSYLRLSACDGMVFVAANQVVCGVEALVLEDGSCSLPRVKFGKILATYAPKNVISIEADRAGLRIGGFSMRTRRYEETAVSPADFQRFILTDRSWMGR